MAEISIDNVINKYNVPGYAHFDRRLPLLTAYEYVSKPENVSSHAFFPFIHYEKYQVKFNGKEKVKKVREICYPAHIDSVIYQHYSYMLNSFYNYYAFMNDIDKCVLAYRTSKSGCCNIHFAKEVIDFIKLQNNAYVIIGDFKDFFPSINHKHLKLNLCRLLNCTALPSDVYAVFKNVTKFSYVELEQLLSLHGLSAADEDIRLFNCKKSVLDDYSLSDLKKKFSGIIKQNTSGRSIPQGSPISGVLANIYMLDFDTSLYNLVSRYKGLYRRYSDDFIVIIPQAEWKAFLTVFKSVVELVEKTPGLILESKKTNVYYCHDKTVDFFDWTGGWQTDKRLSYLGFSFDGKNVYIRDKTITKYYYRMIRKIKGIKNLRAVYGGTISGRVLYERYSKRRSLERDNSSIKQQKLNFIDYVSKAVKVFGKDEKVNLVLKRHMAHIRKHLKR